MPSVGLSMIVRNAEADLRPCLKSARPLVEQIVIADTGSTDRTREIAAEFGATLVSFPWTDHFGDARNAALEPVTTDWVLVLDADEELAPEAAEKLPELLRGSHGIGGYFVTIRNYVPDRFSMTFEKLSRVNRDDVPRAGHAPSYTEHEMIRLFRRHPEIRFSGRIHEGVDPRIKQLGLGIGHANFRIRHFGHLRTAEKKRAYYLDLGRQKVAEQPESALAWFELGCEYYNAGLYKDALESMHHSVAVQPWALPVLFMARIHAMEKRFDTALAALELIPDKEDLGLLRNELRGDLLHDLGRFREARLAYQTALRFSPERRGLDPSGREANIESKLGYTEVRLGLVRMGLGKLRRALEAMPDLIDNHDRLVKALVLLKRDAEAAEAADNILNYYISDRIVLRAAALCERSGRRGRARELLEHGIRKLPETAALTAMLATLGSDVEPGKAPESLPAAGGAV